MSVYLVEPDDPIILGVQLYDGDGTKFVRAFVFNEFGVPVTGSPFLLSHQSQGFYTFLDVNNFKYPLTGDRQIRATYIVYNDAGFTVENECHSRVIDMYRPFEGSSSTTPDPDPTAGIPSLNLIGIISDMEISGTIQSDEILGEIELFDLVGVIESSGEIHGNAEVEGIVGIITCDS